MLREPDKVNFDTLSKAFSAGDVALVEIKRLSDDASVAAICAVGREGDLFVLTPFAILVEGNPFELYAPPSSEGSFEGAQL